jgi:hypothetical protein
MPERARVGSLRTDAASFDIPHWTAIDLGVCVKIYHVDRAGRVADLQHWREKSVGRQPPSKVRSYLARGAFRFLPAPSRSARNSHRGAHGRLPTALCAGADLRSDQPLSLPIPSTRIIQLESNSMPRRGRSSRTRRKPRIGIGIVREFAPRQTGPVGSSISPCCRPSAQRMPNARTDRGAMNSFRGGR